MSGRPSRFGGWARPRHVVALAATLLVTLSGVVAAPTAHAAGCAHPGQILDLTNWELQTPLSNNRGSILQIRQPELAAYEQPPYFSSDPRNCGAGVTFRAPINGVHTSGSHYARTELREMSDGGRAEAAWSSTSGTHTFTETIAFTALPQGKPDVVGAQIHNATEDLSQLVLRGTALSVNAGGTIVKLINDNYHLGTKVEMKWVVSGGVTRAYVDGVLRLTYPRAYDGAFFKAGAYPQADCTRSSPCDAGNYGAVTITSLSVTHTGA